jgi:hypothetical protein
MFISNSSLILVSPCRFDGEEVRSKNKNIKMKSEPGTSNETLVPFPLARISGGPSRHRLSPPSHDTNNQNNKPTKDSILILIGSHVIEPPPANRKDPCQKTPNQTSNPKIPKLSKTRTAFKYNPKSIAVFDNPCRVADDFTPPA